MRNSPGVKIRNLRKSKGISLGNFASKVGISKAYLSQIENGKRSGISYTLAAKIASHLDVSTDEIFLDKTLTNEEQKVL